MIQGEDERLLDYDEDPPAETRKEYTGEAVNSAGSELANMSLKSQTASNDTEMDETITPAL
ncbi:hypothetical protein AAVH_26893 [Aphelenchoides avenae]|nr:hypothetical protein AAVH_26893 [Aphelenchus avenae]